MVHAPADGTRLKAFRLAALLLSVFLIFLGTANFFKSSLASTVEDDDPDYPQLFDDVESNLKRNYLDQDRVGPRARKLTERALSMLENMVDEIYVENSDPDNPHLRVHVGDKVKVVPMTRIANL